MENYTGLVKFADLCGNTDVYDDRYELQRTSGPDRLVIAPRGNQIELLTKLISILPGPFGVLYCLVVGRAGRAEARYQLAAQLSLEEAELFLWDYQVFFERDGRHHVWVGSIADGATLVYDRHNVIYAYGEIEQYRKILEQLGFTEGAVFFPGPHSHHYHQELDQEEDRLMKSHEWYEFPLLDSDRE